MVYAIPSIIPQRAETLSDQILALRHAPATLAHQTPCSTAQLSPRRLLQRRGVLLFEFSSQRCCLLRTGCNRGTQRSGISTCPRLRGKRPTCLTDQQSGQPVASDVPSTALPAGSAQGMVTVSTNDGQRITLLCSSAPQTASSPN